MHKFSTLPTIRFTFSAIVLMVLFISCSSQKKSISETRTHPLDDLAALMIGSFDSSAQAELDSAYYPISLHMYPIWTDRDDARWLYVEQAVSSMPNKPYRQRVYELKALEDGTISSEVYVLPYDSVFIGKYDQPAFFEDYGPEDLQLREGCAVYLKRLSPSHYTGATEGNACISTMRGANYASSKVEIQPGMISSWDQGFNDQGEQMWGAEKGPYIFKKSK